MSKHVAFLRAINVGTHATVRMTDLRDAFAAAGCKDVRTYIQSGNVIFQAPARNSAAVFQRVLVKLCKLLGAEPGIMFRTDRDLEEIVGDAPFKGLEAQRAIKLYVAFLARKPRNRPRFPLVSVKEALEAVAMRDQEVFIVSRRKKSGF